MTTNRTSEAAQTLRSFLSQTFNIEGRPEKEELTLTNKELRAICERFNRMEEDLQWLLKNGNPNSKQLLVIKHALAFDPLDDRP